MHFRLLAIKIYYMFLFFSLVYQLPMFFLNGSAMKAKNSIGASIGFYSRSCFMVINIYEHVYNHETIAIISGQYFSGHNIHCQAWNTYLEIHYFSTSCD